MWYFFLFMVCGDGSIVHNSAGGPLTAVYRDDLTTEGLEPDHDSFACNVDAFS